MGQFLRFLLQTKHTAICLHFRNNEFFYLSQHKRQSLSVLVGICLSSFSLKKLQQYWTLLLRSLKIVFYWILNFFFWIFTHTIPELLEIQNYDPFFIIFRIYSPPLTYLSVKSYINGIFQILQLSFWTKNFWCIPLPTRESEPYIKWIYSFWFPTYNCIESKTSTGLHRRMQTLFYWNNGLI